MEDQIKELIEALKEALPLLPQLDDLKSIKEGYESDVTAAKNELLGLKAQLETANGALSKAQLIAQQDHDKSIYEKQQELKSVAARVTDATTKLSDLNAQVASKQSLHDQLVASLESLKKKFA